MKTNTKSFTGGGQVTLEKGFDETIFNNFSGGGTVVLDSDLDLDEDFFNAGGRRKGCKELGLKGKALRKCAKDLKKAGYTKGGEIPESVMKKYAPQLVQQAASEVDSLSQTGLSGGSGLAGGVARAKSAASAAAEMVSKADTKSAGMTMPKKVAIGVGVFAIVVIIGVVIKKSMAK